MTTSSTLATHDTVAITDGARTANRQMDIPQTSDAVAQPTFWDILCTTSIYSRLTVQALISYQPQLQNHAHDCIYKCHAHVLEYVDCKTHLLCQMHGQLYLHWLRYHHHRCRVLWKQPYKSATYIYHSHFIQYRSGVTTSQLGEGGRGGTWVSWLMLV